MPNHVMNVITLNGTEEEIKELLTKFDAKFNEEKALINLSFEKISPRPKELNICSGSETNKAYELALEFQKNGTSQLYKEKVERFKFEEGEQSKDTSYMFDGVNADGKETYAQSPKNLGDALFIGQQMIKNIENHGAKDWYDWSVKNWGTKWGPYEADLNKLNSEGTTVALSFSTAWSFPEPIIEKLCEIFPNLQMSGVFSDEDTYGSNHGSWENCSGVLCVDRDLYGDKHKEIVEAAWGEGAFDHDFDDEEDENEE